MARDHIVFDGILRPPLLLNRAHDVLIVVEHRFEDLSGVLEAWPRICLRHKGRRYVRQIRPHDPWDAGPAPPERRRLSLF